MRRGWQVCSLVFRCIGYLYPTSSFQKREQIAKGTAARECNVLGDRKTRSGGCRCRVSVKVDDY